MLNVSQCGINNSTAFGANPKFVGNFSKESKNVLKNIPAIRDFKGDVTFTLKKGLRNSMLENSGTCKKLQMNAMIGNKGKLIETLVPIHVKKDTIIVDNFIKSYKDRLGEMLSHLSK